MCSFTNLYLLQVQQTFSIQAMKCIFWQQYSYFMPSKHALRQIITKENQNNFLRIQVFPKPPCQKTYNLFN